MLVYRQVSTTLLNDKVKVTNSCVKQMDKKTCESKVVGSRRLLICKYICSNWHTIVVTKARMKLPRDISVVLVECNYFLKLPNINEKLSNSSLYTGTPLWQWIYHKRFRFTMKIVCDTKINEIIHDRIIYLKVIIVIQQKTWNSPYK